MKFFSSDHHFNHEKIMKHDQRPWNNVDSMNRELIALWNEAIHPRDHVYYLGDFGFKIRGDWSVLSEIMAQLNGKFHFIYGNHDYRNPIEFPANKVQWYGDIHETKIKGQRVVLCHYPLESWNASCHGSWHLHGHTHSAHKITAPNRLNISCTAWGFKPISEETVWETLSSNN